MNKHFSIQNYSLSLQRNKETYRVITDASLSIGEGEIVGLIGESGCGKTVLWKSAFGLMDEHVWRSEGNVILRGEALDRSDKAKLLSLRGKDVSVILQDPMSAFDQVFTIEQHFWETAKTHKVWLAAQCCEHLNRAIIMEAACAKQYGLPRVNVVPQKKAGGSFATAAYANFEKPVAIEEMHIARAGLDIGDTFIGMHMDKVCVPVRLSMKQIGEAHLTACRVRPKFIGGNRAVYDESLK